MYRCIGTHCLARLLRDGLERERWGKPEDIGGLKRMGARFDRFDSSSDDALSCVEGMGQVVKVMVGLIASRCC